jgi:hypothetical protein
LAKNSCSLRSLILFEADGLTTMAVSALACPEIN